jgi:hypothetical protein
MREWFNPARLPPFGHEENRCAGFRGDTLTHRSHAQSLEPAALVRAEDDHVRTERTRLKQGDVGRITMLNPDGEVDRFPVGPLPELFGQRHALTTLGAKRLARRNRLDRHEFGAVLFAERQRVIERAAGCLRKIDGCENASELNHDASEKLMKLTVM